MDIHLDHSGMLVFESPHRYNGVNPISGTARRDIPGILLKVS